MDIDLLVKLNSRVWSVKIIALMHEGVAGRQAPLLAASGASRTAFRQSLEHLIELGMIARNPGHGHPLRAEYCLTALGQQIAPTAHQFDHMFNKKPYDGLLRKNWTIPILTISPEATPFGALKQKLPTITDKALSDSLKALQQSEWIERRVATDHCPPRPFYRAINTGAEIGALWRRELGIPL